MARSFFFFVIFLLIGFSVHTCLFACIFNDPNELRQQLKGYWKLRGDCKDYSDNQNHGINHGVDLDKSFFNGRDAFIEIPNHESLKIGKKDFTISAWVYTQKVINDTLGDIVNFYDPKIRKGFNFGLHSSAGGYQSSGDDRHLYFGIDNSKVGDWIDCGMPNPKSNYVSNSLTVFDGDLYAATIDSPDESDWCHVYKYAGKKEWIDCGRVGKGKTTGVMGLIVHKGKLYAATSTYDWTRVFSGHYDHAHVYRYDGKTNWVDCGKPGNMLRINCMASYEGKLFVGGDRGLPPPGEKQWTGRPYKIYCLNEDGSWSQSGTFPPEPPRSLYPHAMAVHDGKLFAAYPNVFSFDGNQWQFSGTPIGKTPLELKPHLQVHSLSIFQGKLMAGMWPQARVVEYQGGENWMDRGSLGDGSEINALCVFNGKLYAGSIPRGEIFRYESQDSWISLKKFFSPKGWNPGPPIDPVRKEINNWTRVTSLTVYKGRLFASIGSCTSSFRDAPAGIRGSVYSFTSGEAVTYDKDLGSGWNHLTVLRERGVLKIYINGELKVQSQKFNQDEYDLSASVPLRIGFGEYDYFSGKIQEVRLYHHALKAEQIKILRDIGKP